MKTIFIHSTLAVHRVVWALHGSVHQPPPTMCAAPTNLAAGLVPQARVAACLSDEVR